MQALDANEVRPVHLLLALTEEGNGARDLLVAHGVTEDAVSAALGARRPAPPAPLGDDDAAALRSSASTSTPSAMPSTSSSAGALDGQPRPQPGATSSPTSTRPTRPWVVRLGGGVRFGRGAKKVLELSVREAMRVHSREIRSEHIALAVLRTDDEAVRMLLGTLGVDVAALRADLDGRGRRTA